MVFMIPEQTKRDIITLRTLQIEARDAGDVVRASAFGDSIDAELDDLNLINGPARAVPMIFR